MLEAVALTKSYGTTRVLDEVGLTLHSGECLGVAGHNGSGKSTLLALLAQVTPPDSGDVRCDGVGVLGNRRFLRERLGYIPQQNGLLDDLTVGETLQFWQRTYGVSGNLFTPSSPATMLGLDALQKKRVGALSGGTQKRLSIAIALLHRPDYLLLDEVFAPLDRQHRRLLAGWLAAFRAQGGAVLYCSHEAGELLDTCDRILVLRSGQVVFSDTVAAFPDEAETLDEIMNPLPAVADTKK